MVKRSTQIIKCAKCNTELQFRSLPMHLVRNSECAKSYPDFKNGSFPKQKVKNKINNKVKINNTRINNNKQINDNRQIDNRQIVNHNGNNFYGGNFEFNVNVNNIIIPPGNPYPFPKTTHLEIGDIETILDDKSNKIKTYVELMYFNNKKASGQNVIYDGDENQYIIYDGNKWIQSTLQFVIEKIFSKMIKNIERFIKDNDTRKYKDMKALTQYKNSIREQWDRKHTGQLTTQRVIDTLKENLEKQIKEGVKDGSVMYTRQYLNELSEKTGIDIKNKRLLTITDSDVEDNNKEKESLKNAIDKKLKSKESDSESDMEESPKRKSKEKEQDSESDMEESPKRKSKEKESDYESDIDESPKRKSKEKESDYESDIDESPKRKSKGKSKEKKIEKLPKKKPKAKEESDNEESDDEPSETKSPIKRNFKLDKKEFDNFMLTKQCAKDFGVPHGVPKDKPDPDENDCRVVKMKGKPKAKETKPKTKKKN